MSYYSAAQTHITGDRRADAQRRLREEQFHAFLYISLVENIERFLTKFLTEEEGPTGLSFRKNHSTCWTKPSNCDADLSSMGSRGSDGTDWF
ncbi:hypothetical protein TNCV_2476941 [Trichonephila clavipes]|nr:hypothetical protein TNCV_2476941 [Trichonephila clavipes]